MIPNEEPHPGKLSWPQRKAPARAMLTKISGKMNIVLFEPQLLAHQGTR
jgi:hypothetical protein